jgi:hypothetical protein
MGKNMNVDDVIEDLKKQNPRFDSLQQYEVIKKFIEDKQQLSDKDLNKLEVATIFDNVWCRDYEDKDCEGCPVCKFEKGWGDCASGRFYGQGCVSGQLHPFYEKIDHVWHCITALKNHDKKVRKRDLLNAVNDIIHYLKKAIKETT